MFEFILKECKIFLNKRSFCTKIKETLIDIDGQTINYTKLGHGSKPILLFPGALGTIHTDFGPQIDQLDKEKFTIIGWDPPGYGKSRPPLRKFSKNFYFDDADMAVKLMEKLKIPKYSLLGWSDGGISSMIIAAQNPDKVDALIIWGSNSFILPEELETYKKIRDVSKWSERMRKPMIEQYGEEYFPKLWESWVDAMVEIYNANEGNICDEVLEEIKCPTLIVHGGQDPMVASKHPVHLSKKIKGSELFIFPNGKHNLHFKYAKEFNELVTKFLISKI